ncbi:MAG: hypothetical protein AAFN92_22125, partial [Bacteroidota bacterium]
MGEKQQILARTRIPGGYHTYQLTFGAQESTVILRGFHLNESDFRSDREFPLADYWEAKGQAILYLRLRSTEKLLLVYREVELIGRLPVGRQIDEINVGSWDKG